jgi:hypothetical protein
MSGATSRLQNANVVTKSGVSGSIWFVQVPRGERPEGCGAPIGPLPASEVASMILAGTVSADVLVAAPHGSRWVRATDVPVIAGLLDGAPTRRARESGLRAAARTDSDAPPTERSEPPISSGPPTPPTPRRSSGRFDETATSAGQNTRRQG